ncbi:MAG: hypothetical protein WCD11_08890, partial [Solirubrobacteraceae bacterium]
SPAPPATAEGTFSAAGAATVQRRDLVETDTESGTLSYADPQTVYDRLSGTITWLPVIGQAISRGQVLFDVDNEPVILLYGSTPAYRRLSSSDSAGPDIRELNSNLIALGYRQYGLIADDSWQTATTDAIDALQYTLGEKQTGSFSLGRVVFLPGEQLVNTVDGTVGSPTVLDDPSASTEFVDLTTTVTTPTTRRGRRNSRHKKHRRRKRRGKQPRGAETGSPKTGSAKTGSAKTGSAAGTSGSGSKSSSTATAGSAGSSSGSGSSSSSGPGGAAVLQTSSTHLIATVDLPASSQSEAAVGSQVSVEMPNATTVAGTITAVSPIAQTASNNGGAGGSGGNGSSGSSGGGGGGGASSASATVPVTITLDQRVEGAGLDQAAVSVGFAQARARDVLSVPVTSLLAISGGGYALAQAVPPHRLIPVTTGLFAAGYVQISGSGIYPGLEVTDSQG